MINQQEFFMKAQELKQLLGAKGVVVLGYMEQGPGVLVGMAHTGLNYQELLLALNHGIFEVMGKNRVSPAKESSLVTS